MYKNFVKIALRNLIKNKTNSFISIFGLAIGMAVCILLLLYVQHELSYDHFHINSDHIYRICQPEHPYHSPQTAKLLADNLPEIKDYVRILPTGESIVQYEENRFKEEKIVFADPSLLQMFSLKFKRGNSEDALQRPFTMVISEDIASKYFGNENPIGKVIMLDNEFNFTISGVMENMPQNSHFRYDFIASLTNAAEIFGNDWMDNWGWENFLIYIHIPGEFSQPALEAKCTELFAKHRNSDSSDPLPDFSLQKLSDIHLYSGHFKNDIQPQNSITYVLIFSAIGILILLIACFNYINLLTANAATRAKEIGIKKVVGATRKQLATQFIGESVVVLFMALILSLIIVEISLPIFNNLSGKVISFTALIQVKTTLGIIGIVFVTGIIAGCYPAFFLSTLQPVKALKTSTGNGRSKYHFRTILVGAQFTIVIILISSAIFMFRQINYLQKKELGINKEYVLISEVSISFDNLEKYNAMKHALLKESVVKSVSTASRVPSNDLNNVGAIRLPGENEWTKVPIVHVGYDYFESLGIEIAQGRFFSGKLKTDADEALILNEKALKVLGTENSSIEKSVESTWPYANRKIVGVINDFHFESLYKQIRPTMFVIDNSQCYKLIVTVNPSNAENTIYKIQAICNNFYPDQIFEFHFLDDKLAALYKSDKKTLKLVGYFTALAIFIAFIGLFGLASFIIKSRTKEIGVRKVLGASITQILISLTKDFAKWILFANLIAWPIAWYSMHKWLQNFAYKTEMGYWIFILAGGIVLLIALLTVSSQAIKAATSNPVNALKYE